MTATRPVGRVQHEHERLVASVDRQRVHPITRVLASLILKDKTPVGSHRMRNKTGLSNGAHQLPPLSHHLGEQVEGACQQEKSVLLGLS